MALLAKSTGHQRGNIRRREIITGDISSFDETRIEIAVKILYPKFAAFDQRRNLLIVVGSGDGAAL
jgi:hypothetical protein